MKCFSVTRIFIGGLVGFLLALPLTGCGKSDSGSSSSDPDKVKQEAERLRQENQKMFGK
jgi:hypothetical protein